MGFTYHDFNKLSFPLVINYPRRLGRFQLLKGDNAMAYTPGLAGKRVSESRGHDSG